MGHFYVSSIYFWRDFCEVFLSGVWMLAHKRWFVKEIGKIKGVLGFTHGDQKLHSGGELLPVVNNFDLVLIYNKSFCLAYIYWLALAW